MLNFRVERKQKIIEVTLGVFHYAQNRLAYSHFLFFFFLAIIFGYIEVIIKNSQHLTSCEMFKF